MGDEDEDAAPVKYVAGFCLGLFSAAIPRGGEEGGYICVVFIQV